MLTSSGLAATVVASSAIAAPRIHANERNTAIATRILFQITFLKIEFTKINQLQLEKDWLQMIE